MGRFDAVKVLLDGGADAGHLGWTPLIAAVAIGELAEVQRLVQAGAPLEEADWWSRTAWLVAVQTGDAAKASYLRESGANIHARGRCGKPPLFYAIESHKPDMLRWLLEIGQDPEQTDDFGATPLTTAVEYDDGDCLELLLEAGVEVDRKRNDFTSLHDVRSRRIAMRLLDAGAEPSGLSYEGHRLLLRYPSIADEPLLEVTPEQFQAGRSPRFGRVHPEPLQDRFWEAMIRAGVTGYAANQFFQGPSSLDSGPVWCAQRFGQSITFLPDGTIVQIGGEHEDSYDPDFCIYNDVFVHGTDGKIRAFGYPESVFPPTDFHSATLIESHIYIIGSLGYQTSRRAGYTPVYRLDTSTYRIERLEVPGEAPGWIYGHRAIRSSSREIRIAGGKIITPGNDHLANERCFVLDLDRLIWRIDHSTPRK